MIHVDLVRNDVVAGIQTCIGRVSSSGDLGVKVECDDPSIERLLREPLNDAVNGGCVSPQDNGDRFVELLAHAWNGTYVLATPVHDDDACAFAHVMTLSMPVISRV